MKLEEFKGKSVVVTGAGAGMGKAITQGFLENGATVIGVDIKEEALSAFKEELKKSDVETAERFIPLTGDISKEATNEAMIQKALDVTGKIDILVNNAGVAGHSEPVTETTNEDWDRILRVNLDGPMYAIRAAVRQMLRQENGGSIVTIASVAGIKGCRSCAAYSAAKHGLVGLCEHTAYTYMHQGIRSNIVCPGAIRTGMTSNPELENSFGRERIIAAMKKFCDDNGYYYTSQLTNDANWQAHIKSTGPEIVEDTDGDIDYAVMLAGTAGTLTGVGKYLQEHIEGIKIVVILPDDGMKYLSTRMYRFD